MTTLADLQKSSAQKLEKIYHQGNTAWTLELLSKSHLFFWHCFKYVLTL